MTEKKTQLLGMNPATASYRLVKDLLWDFVQKSGCSCHRCGQPMTRETFSVEHKNSWQDAENPAIAFFDLDNVAYSHLSCNIRAAKRRVAKCGTISKYTNGCRCTECIKAKQEDRQKYYTPEKRRDKYLRTGT